MQRNSPTKLYVQRHGRRSYRQSFHPRITLESTGFSGPNRRQFVFKLGRGPNENCGWELAQFGDIATAIQRYFKILEAFGYKEAPTPCCDNESRSMEGGCTSCNDTCI